MMEPLHEMNYTDTFFHLQRKGVEIKQYRSGFKVLTISRQIWFRIKHFKISWPIPDIKIRLTNTYVPHTLLNISNRIRFLVSKSGSHSLPSPLITGY